MGRTAISIHAIRGMGLTGVSHQKYSGGSFCHVCSFYSVTSTVIKSRNVRGINLFCEHTELPVPLAVLFIHREPIQLSLRYLRDTVIS